MPRSDYPSQFCHATKDDLLKIDGLNVCDDCPKCKIRDVSCEVACHPITNSGIPLYLLSTRLNTRRLNFNVFFMLDENSIARNFSNCASMVTSFWGSCLSISDVSKVPFSSNKSIIIRNEVRGEKQCGQMQRYALANCLGGLVCRDEEISEDKKHS